MPRLIELTASGPLAPQVAAWLLTQAQVGSCVDLSDFTVVVPTSAAGRKLRRALILALGPETGLLPPQMVTPMQLFPSAPLEATRLEQWVAWATVITQADPESYPELFGAFPSALETSQAFRLATQFSDLASLLAEAGLAPDSVEVARVCELEGSRWKEIGLLYRAYLAALAKPDPNELKLAAIRNAPSRSGRLVIAGVPDLPRLVRLYLAKQCVEVLVARPPSVPAEWDEWGQPHRDYWLNSLLPVPSDCIHVSSNPAAEASMILEKWQPATSVVCAEESFKIRLTRRFGDEGYSAYDPAGVSLMSLEAGRLLMDGLTFRRTRNFRDLRRLLESPRALRWLTLGGDSLMILKSLDQLTEKHLLSTLDDACAFFKNRKECPVWLDELNRRVEQLDPLHLREWLAELFAGEKWDEEQTEAMALREIAEVLTEVARVTKGADAFLFEQLLQKSLEEQRVYPNHPADALELNGWLEILWMEEPQIIVSGCVEGNLPDLVMGHPFLPDQARSALGLASNASRFAREAYLLHCVLAQRPASGLVFTLSRRGEDGEPLKPSRLLLRCPDAELADRVEQLFQLPSTERAASARVLPFRFHLSPPILPSSLSATDFSQYLKCPLRFYLQRVLRWESLAPDKRELTPADFGTVLHKILENFGRDESIRDAEDEVVIRSFLHEEMDRKFFLSFGGNPSAPLRVQRETLRARLSAFARVQAGEARAGWRILEAEKAFKGEETLQLSDFPIHATLDRIERNERTGQWRVLDYKSHAHTPEKKHFQGLGKKEPLVPEARFDEDKAMRWLDLQLPIYRGIFERHWRDEPSPEVGYFLLPADLQAVQIATLPLPEKRLESAFVCARAIAKRIRQCQFWPPAILPPREDNFATIFLGEDPAEFFDPETVKAFS